MQKVKLALAMQSLQSSNVGLNKLVSLCWLGPFLSRVPSLGIEVEPDPVSVSRWLLSFCVGGGRGSLLAAPPPPHSLRAHGPPLLHLE